MDPRVPDGQPLTAYPLRGERFYPGPARAWSWSVQGGPCDAISIAPSFQLTNATSMDATLFPVLSGDYTVTLRVVTATGNVLTCTWIVHVQGPGLRIEMCYPESTVSDLDLYLHSPFDNAPWFVANGTQPVRAPNVNSVCCWANCEAMLRVAETIGIPPFGRADWHYANSPLANCVNGPQGDQWRTLGMCSNPRLDIDNNLEMSRGRPENINVDRPGIGQTFRIMVQNFTGSVTHPLVNVYCSGRRVATYGAPPDAFPFTGDVAPALGAMWRVADVTTHFDTAGNTTCTVTQIHPPGTASGYWITQNSARY
jgi:hypothetical protein